MSTKLTDDNPLSARELDVAQLLVTGASNSEIAYELIISPQTVKVHVRNLYEKLGASSRAEATLLLLQKGWLNLSDLEIGQPANGETVPEPPPPEPEPLVDCRAQPQLWQKIYLLGVVLLCLVLFWIPNRLKQPESARVDLLTDGTSTIIGLPNIDITSRWKFLVPMSLARGRLAVANHNEWIYALGGEDRDGQAVDAVNAYSVSINEWKPISPLPIPLSNAASATFQNRLYVAGGSNDGVRIDGTRNPSPDDAKTSISQTSISDALLIYDLETTLWNSDNRLPNPLAGAALVAADDAIYLIGGWDGETMHNEIWRLAPTDEDTTQSARWELVTRLDVPRAFLGATEVAGEIYVVGGYDGQKELVLADVYTLATNRWRRLPDLSFPRGGLSLVADELAIFALGGGWTAPLDNHERFDLATGIWSNFPSPVQGSWRHFAATNTEGNGHIHLIGGWGGDYLDLHLRYQSSFRSLLPVITND